MRTKLAQTERALTWNTLQQQQARLQESILLPSPKPWAYKHKNKIGWLGMGHNMSTYVRITRLHEPNFELATSGKYLLLLKRETLRNVLERLQDEMVIEMNSRPWKQDYFSQLE